jgi:hypothetical protein
VWTVRPLTSAVRSRCRPAVNECRLGRSSDSSVLVKAKVRCSRFGAQLAVPAAAWALALRSLSMFTWSLSIPVSTLRATASRSAMSGVASE